MINKIENFENYLSEYKKSVENPELFWSEKAEHFVWRKKWNNVLEWDFLKAETRWFLNAKLNITENCLDRHLQAKGEHIAFIWEPNDPKEIARTFTYKELHTQVSKFANVLKQNGAKKRR